MEQTKNGVCDTPMSKMLEASPCKVPGPSILKSSKNIRTKIDITDDSDPAAEPLIKRPVDSDRKHTGKANDLKNNDSFSRPLLLESPDFPRKDFGNLSESLGGIQMRETGDQTRATNQHSQKENLEKVAEINQMRNTCLSSFTLLSEQSKSNSAEETIKSNGNYLNSYNKLTKGDDHDSNKLLGAANKSAASKPSTNMAITLGKSTKSKDSFEVGGDSRISEKSKDFHNQTFCQNRDMEMKPAGSLQTAASSSTPGTATSKRRSTDGSTIFTIAKTGVKLDESTKACQSIASPISSFSEKNESNNKSSDSKSSLNSPNNNVILATTPVKTIPLEKINPSKIICSTPKTSYQHSPYIFKDNKVPSVPKGPETSKENSQGCPTTVAMDVLSTALASNACILIPKTNTTDIIKSTGNDISWKKEFSDKSVSAKDGSARNDTIANNERGSIKLIPDEKTLSSVSAKVTTNVAARTVFTTSTTIAKSTASTTVSTKIPSTVAAIAPVNTAITTTGLSKNIITTATTALTAHPAPLKTSVASTLISSTISPLITPTSCKIIPATASLITAKTNLPIAATDSKASNFASAKMIIAATTTSTAPVKSISITTATETNKTPTTTIAPLKIITTAINSLALKTTTVATTTASASTKIITGVVVSTPIKPAVFAVDTNKSIVTTNVPSKIITSVATSSSIKPTTVTASDSNKITSSTFASAKILAAVPTTAPNKSSTATTEIVSNKPTANIVTTSAPAKTISTTTPLAPDKPTSTAAPVKTTNVATSTKAIITTTIPAKITSSTTIPAKITSSTTIPAKVTSSTTIPAKVTSSTTIPAKNTSSTTIPAKITSSNTVPATAAGRIETTKPKVAVETPRAATEVRLPPKLSGDKSLKLTEGAGGSAVKTNEVVPLLKSMTIVAKLPDQPTPKEDSVKSNVKKKDIQTSADGNKSVNVKSAKKDSKTTDVRGDADKLSKSKNEGKDVKNSSNANNQKSDQSDSSKSEKNVTLQNASNTNKISADVSKLGLSSAPASSSAGSSARPEKRML